MICQYQITFMSFPKNVGQMAVDSVYYRVVGDVEAVTSRKVGWGELRGKQHRSNRCGAFAAWKDKHLHRREDNPTEAKLIEAPCSKTCRRAQVESLRRLRSLVQFNMGSDYAGLPG